MTREEELDMTLADGTPNPAHPDVADFMAGMRERFLELSAAHEKLMNGGQSPVVIAFGATVTPEALAGLHDQPPKSADDI